MRNMSFSKTTEQVRNRTKYVTRRYGWWNVVTGERIQAIVKGMGLKKGEKVEKLHVIEILDSRPDRLANITYAECVLEGFPHWHPNTLRKLLRSICPKGEDPEHPNRIAFKYVD